MNARLRVIGIGNRDRADDGVGPLVADLLRRRAPEGVEVLECDGEMTRLIDAMAGADRVVMVDAVTSGGAAGTVHALAAGSPGLVSARSASTHGLGLAEALGLAARLGRLPGRLLIYGVEAATVTVGGELDLAVRRGAERVVEMILAEAG